MKSIKQLSREIHQNAVNKGFWEENYNTAEKLMLIVSEISEALEADRKSYYADLGNSDLQVIEADMLNDEDYKALFERKVKNTFEDELADALIRILDLAHKKGINLEWHIRAKMRYNSLRPYKHGKKY